MERFIIGTGRCGSTLLSIMLTHHPEVLVLSEFTTSIRPVDVDHGASISGNAYADRLSRPNPIIDMLIRRAPVPKEILNTGDKEDATASIPAICLAMLPTLTDRPAELFQASIEQVRTFPEQSVASHNRMYFEWLQAKLGKKFWVERGGASIEVLPDLVRMYPNAKFVHIHRDGPEAALSMREHDYFKLAVSFYFDPLTRAELEQTELGGKPISANDPMTQRMTTRLPSYEQFGEFWSHNIDIGVPELAKMGSEKLLTVRFEDLLAQPVTVLNTISGFFGFPESPGWVDSAARLVDKAPKTRVHLLPKQDRAALLRGCERGQVFLGRVARETVFDDAFRLLYDIKGIR